MVLPSFPNFFLFFLKRFYVQHNQAAPLARFHSISRRALAGCRFSRFLRQQRLADGALAPVAECE